MSTYAKARLMADAINRSGRSLLQALVAEVVLIVVPELVRLLQDEATVWDVNVARSLGQVALFAALAFAHRRFLDLTPVPSLLPPADPGRPADPEVRP